MRKIIFIIIGALFLSVSDLKASGSLADSVGFIQENGKAFILYEVSKGETLFSISRKFQLPMDQIIKGNPEIENNTIRVGQVIRIPAPQYAAYSSQHFINHIVKEGETLFGISRKYEVSMAEIVQWNELKTLDLAIGQELKIKSEAKAQEREEFEELVFEQDVEEEEVKETAREIRTRSYVFRDNVLSLKYQENTSTDLYREVNQSGIATWITDTSPNAHANGYFALHKTLPVGTVIKIRNPMNNRMVFARVIANLPDSIDNENILLKLPEAAAREMRILDQRTNVTISYLERID